MYLIVYIEVLTTIFFFNNIYILILKYASEPDFQTLRIFIPFREYLLTIPTSFFQTRTTCGNTETSETGGSFENVYVHIILSKSRNSNEQFLNYLTLCTIRFKDNKSMIIGLKHRMMV